MRKTNKGSVEHIIKARQLVLYGLAQEQLHSSLKEHVLI